MNTVYVYWVRKVPFLGGTGPEAKRRQRYSSRESMEIGKTYLLPALDGGCYRVEALDRTIDY